MCNNVIAGARGLGGDQNGENKNIEERRLVKGDEHNTVAVH